MGTESVQIYESFCSQQSQGGNGSVLVYASNGLSSSSFRFRCFFPEKGGILCLSNRKEGAIQVPVSIPEKNSSFQQFWSCFRFLKTVPMAPFSESDSFPWPSCKPLLVGQALPFMSYCLYLPAT